MYKDLIIKKRKIALVGLGYVGLPIAMELSKHVSVIGFDINEEPPKVSIRVSSLESTNATGEILEFNIEEQLDAILETPDVDG